MFKRRKRKQSRRVKTKTRNLSSRHRKTIQSRKNKCKTCPTKRETDKIFFGNRRKQKKES